MTSVWNSVNQESKNFQKYTHWPNPFNVLKQMDVLACNPVWIARFEFYLGSAADFFWSNFVPSPVELTRKAFTGGYKCGFYIPLKVKSPIDIIGRGNTGVIMGEILGPFTTGLFYWWAAQTAFDALNTWSSIINAQEACDEDSNSALMRGGHVSMKFASEGSVPFYQIVYDPNNWCNETTGFILPPPGWRSAWASLTIASLATPDTANVEVYIDCAGLPENHISVSIPPGGTVTLGPQKTGIAASNVQVRCRLLNDLSGAFGHIEIIVQRFRCSFSDEDPGFHHFNDQDIYTPNADATLPCIQRFQPVSPPG